MSIINDTLKSLEGKRQQAMNASSLPGENADKAAHASPEYTLHQRSSTRRYLWAAMGVGVCALAAIAWVLVTHPTKTTHKLAMNTPAATHAPVKKDEPSSPSASANEVTSTPVASTSTISAPIANKTEATVKLSPKTNPSPVSLVIPNETATNPPMTAAQAVSDLKEALDAHDSNRFNAVVNHIAAKKHWRKALAAVLTQLEEQSSFVAAEHLLHAFRKRMPTDVSLRMQLAHLYLDEGNSARAVSFLESSHMAVEEHTDYYALLAYALVKEKHYKQSIAMYQQLVSIDSSEPTWWMGLGVAYLYDGKPHEALESFKRAKAHTGKHAPYRYFLSQQIHTLSGDRA